MNVSETTRQSRRSRLASRVIGLQLDVSAVGRAGMKFRVHDEIAPREVGDDGVVLQSFRLELPPEWHEVPVAIGVEQQGMLSDGPWGVDLYLAPNSGPLTPSETRTVAHALLAAADLAERVQEQDPLAEHEVPC